MQPWATNTVSFTFKVGWGLDELKASAIQMLVYGGNELETSGCLLKQIPDSGLVPALGDMESVPFMSCPY